MLVFVLILRSCLKSVIARDGARSVSSSSSSVSASDWRRVRARLVPAREILEAVIASEVLSVSRLDGRLLVEVESMLVLRASMRSRARLGLTPENDTTLPVSSLSRAALGDSPLTCTLGLRPTVDVNERIAGLAKLCFVSHNAIQSSVKLRQMLSAFRRTCLSAVPVPL